MTDERPPVIDCDRCGQPAYVTVLGIACACLPGLSAAERFARDARRALSERRQQRRRAA